MYITCIRRTGSDADASRGHAAGQEILTLGPTCWNLQDSVRAARREWQAFLGEIPCRIRAQGYNHSDNYEETGKRCRFLLLLYEGEST